jgi:transcriptional regulator with XRE-family HTH domain
MSAEYGRFIKQRREQRGHTQQEFADRVGVSRGTVANWEKGDMPDYLPELVKYLSTGLPVEEDRSYQMVLPFGHDSNIELRVSPQRADTIRFEVQLHEKAS